MTCKFIDSKAGHYNRFCEPQCINGFL